MKYSDIKVSVETDVKTINFNQQDITVKQYIY